jgi:hypothetical protein
MVYRRFLDKAERAGLKPFFGAIAQKTKKRGVPRLHGKHAAWELLSPDLGSV